VRCQTCVRAACEAELKSANYRVSDDAFVFTPPVTKKVLRGLHLIADVADCEGQLDGEDQQAAVAWLRETGWVSQ
jgi:hypothetical protein